MPAISRIVPCLWFDDQAEPAAAFYVRSFPNAHRDHLLAV
jgi:predicted 3-demethylubiquinone-9 3-methyltransferase (glyoxalase superfamily)